MENKLLIIGKTPPPVGGVTIHVKRLIDFLQINNFNFLFIELSKKNLLKIIFNISKFKCIHLHTNNVYLQLFFVLSCKVFKIHSILTLHGEVNQHKCWIKNWLEICSFRFASFPIVLNNHSFVRIYETNKQTILDTAYIKPPEISELPSYLYDLISLNKKKFKGVYCTNAYHRVFDKYNNELYGIEELVDLFQFSDYSLVVCDPSGTYKKIFQNLSDSIIVVDFPIDFISLLMLVDGFIRNTTTDGDSISIHEALNLNVPVFCTDVVNRPIGTIIYRNAKNELLDLIKLNPKANFLQYHYNGNKIFDIYRRLLMLNLFILFFQ